MVRVWMGEDDGVQLVHAERRERGQDHVFPDVPKAHRIPTAVHEEVASVRKCDYEGVTMANGEQNQPQLPSRRATDRPKSECGGESAC